MKDKQKIASAAGWDAGNRNMIKAGRAAWNEDDWNEAARVYESVYPLEAELEQLRKKGGQGEGNY